MRWIFYIRSENQVDCSNCFRNKQAVLESSFKLQDHFRDLCSLLLSMVCSLINPIVAHDAAM